MIKNDRIGTFEEWPKVTISGAKYIRPCSTIVLGHGYFAVLDNANSADDIEELKGIVEKAMAKDNLKLRVENVQTKDKKS